MIPKGRVESEFFRTLNSLVEPVARAGFFSPDRWPAGVIVARDDRAA